MRKNITRLSIVFAIIFVGVLNGCGNQQKVYPYPFQTAKIELEQSGNLKGKVTLYIKGDRTAQESHLTKTTEEGKEEKIDTLYLTLGDTVYQVDLNNQTAVKSENVQYNQLKKLPMEKRMDFLTRTALSLPSTQNDTLAPKEQRDIAGQKCDLYEIPTIGESCVWNGIIIYESSQIPEINIDNTITATKIELNTDIPDSIFALPEGVTVQNAT